MYYLVKHSFIGLYYIGLYREQWRAERGMLARIAEVMWPCWRHGMEMLFAFLVRCEENPPITDGFPSQAEVTRIFDGFF